MAKRSLAKRLWYDYMRVLLRVGGVSLYHLRISGRENEPTTGGALILSNHQSHLDPMLIGLVFDRRLNFLARETLFRFAPLRWLILSLDSIPIDRDGLGLSGLKETLRRVKQEEMVVIFPEGTRSPDGEVAPLKPGFAALAKRVRAPLVPMGLDGAFQAWPRTRPYPRTGTIHVHIGRPITPEEAHALDDRALVSLVEERIRECHAIARTNRLRAMARWSEPTELYLKETKAKPAADVAEERAAPRGAQAAVLSGH
ncbi:MAG TPA: lysophospholipid acyltransferase family protein [Pirellulales bacterium]|jgi:1-acyl-sn-glycerol-3-phosphate acyltransferase